MKQSHLNCSADHPRPTELPAPAPPRRRTKKNCEFRPRLSNASIDSLSEVAVSARSSGLLTAG